jgi:hypothetical protein
MTFGKRLGIALSLAGLVALLALTMGGMTLEVAGALVLFVLAVLACVPDAHLEPMPEVGDDFLTAHLAIATREA